MSPPTITFKEFEDMGIVGKVLVCLQKDENRLFSANTSGHGDTSLICCCKTRLFGCRHILVTYRNFQMTNRDFETDALHSLYYQDSSWYFTVALGLSTHLAAESFKGQQK